MNRNKFNKKLVNNLILGSFLFGTSAGIITQVQGTQQLPNGRQSIHKYDKEATKQLRELLESSETPLDECIKLVQSNNADPNIQVGLFTLLEEVVLTRSGLSIKPLIDKGADIYKVTGYKEVKNADAVGRTLLHLAVYKPPTARNLLFQHKKEKRRLLGQPREGTTPKDKEENELSRDLYLTTIDNYMKRIHSENELFSPEYEVVKELIDSGKTEEEKWEMVKMICMKETSNSNALHGEEPYGNSAYEVVNDDLKRLLNLKANSSLFRKIQEQYKKIKDLFDEKCGFYEGRGIREWRKERRPPGLFPLSDENRKDGSGPIDFSRISRK